MTYADFLERKTQLDGFYGIEPTWMPDFLFPFQAALVYGAVRNGRRGIGIELKPSYYRQAVRNLATLDDAHEEQSWLDVADVEEVPA